jgi:prevent-host-death family protein
MSEITISVTEAARNFADCVNRAHYQGQEFVLLKNGLPVARLTPVESRRYTTKELARALAKVKLTPAESRAWQRDLKAARKSLKAQPDRWD